MHPVTPPRRTLGLSTSPVPKNLRQALRVGPSLQAPNEKQPGAADETQGVLVDSAAPPAVFTCVAFSPLRGFGLDVMGTSMRVLGACMWADGARSVPRIFATCPCRAGGGKRPGAERKERRDWPDAFLLISPGRENGRRLRVLSPGGRTYSCANPIMSSSLARGGRGPSGCAPAGGSCNPRAIDLLCVCACARICQCCTRRYISLACSFVYLVAPRGCG
ncbi:hypothetical protein PYCCODRAFT_163599 [Trametes coccinea BRFM310]|uniref:Uncharacterized protein n=1 Tax=Trametes coccinea (strain BRFM310) TaxID=1353009 RepID=A0A1Y2ITI0_TRAC3|nr:hypothetical protein PYCCODRAFT_163599 [Trametes coccinea BRFM310]